MFQVIINWRNRKATSHVVSAENADIAESLVLTMTRAYEESFSSTQTSLYSGK